MAEVIDGVIGVDTHRNTHHAGIARPTGAPIATRLISNDSAGYTQLLDWIFEHAPGPRLVVCIEGTRSYRAGLARAAAAAGLTVIDPPGPAHRPPTSPRPPTLSPTTRPIDHAVIITAKQGSVVQGHTEVPSQW